MNKRQFIEAISLRIGEKHSTTLSYVNATLSIISETVKNGDVVVLDDFGKFYLKKISKKTVKKADSDESSNSARTYESIVYTISKYNDFF